MLEKPCILNHFKNEKGKSEVPSPSCSGEGKVVQSVDKKYGISGHKQSLSLVLEPQIPIHRLPLPPQGEIPAENGGLSGKKSGSTLPAPLPGSRGTDAALFLPPQQRRYSAWQHKVE